MAMRTDVGNTIDETSVLSTLSESAHIDLTTSIASDAKATYLKGKELALDNNMFSTKVKVTRDDSKRVARKLINKGDTEALKEMLDDESTSEATKVTINEYLAKDVEL